MDNHTARIFAFIQAELVRVEGMKAENARSLFFNESPTWGQAAFDQAAAHIESLAREIS